MGSAADGPTIVCPSWQISGALLYIRDFFLHSPRIVGDIQWQTACLLKLGLGTMTPGGTNMMASILLRFDLMVSARRYRTDVCCGSCACIPVGKGALREASGALSFAWACKSCPMRAHTPARVDWPL